MHRSTICDSTSFAKAALSLALKNEGTHNRLAVSLTNLFEVFWIHRSHVWSLCNAVLKDMCNQYEISCDVYS